jgi:hypothetical protein
MKFSPLTCYLVPLRLKYSPPHPILKHPKHQVSHLYKITQNYRSVYPNL